MNSEIKKIRKLDLDEITSLTRDSKIIGIRWDLVKWGLVIVLDIPVSEANYLEVHSGWLVFKGISDIDIPLVNVRIPTGCFLSSEIHVEVDNSAFKSYSFKAMLPEFDDSGETITPVTKTIRIKAKELIGLISDDFATVDEYGFMERSVRLQLTPEEDMLFALNNSP